MMSNVSVRAREVGPRFVVDDRDARIAIEVSGEVSELAVDDVDDVAVDLDAGHGTLSELERREHVTAAADADDGHVRGLADVVDEVLDPPPQEIALVARVRVARTSGATRCRRCCR